MPDPVPPALDEAIDKTCTHLLGTARTNGGWQIAPVLAPCATALVYTVLQHLGHTRDGDAEKVRAYILRHQLDNGGFPVNVGYDEATVTSTAACWAALLRSGLPDDDPDVRRAWRYVEENGGLEEVGARALSDPYATGPYLAFVGLLDADLLPFLPLDWVRIPGSLALASEVVNAGMLVGILELATIFSFVKHGPESISEREKTVVIDACTEYQNRDGSINAICLMTLMFLCALDAMGEGPGTTQYDLCLNSLDTSRIETEDELKWMIFGSDVWDTAMNIRGLILSGQPPDHPTILAAIRFLCDAQLQTDLAEPTSTRGPRRGGWAFEFWNDKCPDNDDTAIVMSALAMWLNVAADEPALEGDVDRVQNALDDGIDYLQGMHNADGGWSAYEQGLPGKPRGPLYTKDEFDWTDPRKAFQDIDDDVVQLGDPSTADITGRVLEALALISYTRQAPLAKRGIQFLTDQQMEDGSWWGRWICNYLAGTSWALKGLLHIGCTDAKLIKAGVDFLMAHQNEDGGFGETAKSYADPSLKAQGPSMPGLTGLILGTLCLAGEGNSDVAKSAADYLIRTQEDDGTWSDDQWQHIFLLPDYFYRLPASDTNQTLEGLALHRRALLGETIHAGGRTTERLNEVASGLGDRAAPTVPIRDGNGNWLKSGLRAWRELGDPSADAVVRDIIANGGQEQVSAAFRTMVTNDDPFPPGLDPKLEDWLKNNANLPDWADEDLIAEAQTFYTRVGWSFALCLFTASLPQAYAAADGARVLMGTQGLTDHAVRRILETAQFLFDVLDEGAFAPEGRGLAAARKVRLLHATVRQYTLMRAGWSIPAWGVPINQEDMAGTVQTFSTVMLDAMKNLQIDVHEHEEKAWVHTWACIGHVMGVHDELLPRTPDDARALMQTIRDDQWAPSEHGRELTNQLANSMAQYLPMPDRMGKSIAFMLVREVGGDRCADILGIKQYEKRRQLVRAALRANTRIADWLGRHRNAHDASPFARIATWLMQELIDVQRLGKQTSFRIPPALVHDWGLRD